MTAHASLVKCSSYDSGAVFDSVEKALALLGGIANFIKPKSRVLLKPNLLMAKEPSYAITTHPEVVRAVARLLKRIDCTVYLGDCPSAFGNRTKHIDGLYEKTGMSAVAAEEGLELVRFDKGRWRGKFPLSIWLDKCDYLVSVPKFKTHELMILTGAVKNTFGLITGNYKTQLHLHYLNLDDFARIVVDVFEQARPVLSVVDAILAMEGEGPGSSGTPRNCGFLLCGTDAVALDSILATVMGLSAQDIPTTREASRRGLGVADMRSISVLGDNLQEVIGRPFVLPSTSALKRIPQPVKRIARRLIKYYPSIEHERCIRCAACIQACPNSIMSLRNNRIHIDYSRCIACFCCQETCPESAIKVQKSLLAKIIGL